MEYGANEITKELATKAIQKLKEKNNYVSEAEKKANIKTIQMLERLLQKKKEEKQC